MTILALFHHQGGVGKTMLTQHLAVMMSRLGRRTLAVDLDPQADLTVSLLNQQDQEATWAEHRMPTTVADALAPVLDGSGEPLAVVPRELDDQLWLLPGDLALARAEERLAQCWTDVVLSGREGALRTTAALHRVIEASARQVGADVVLLDLGSNLGAINRAALLAVDHVITPVEMTSISALAMAQLGDAMTRWRSTWRDTVLPREARRDGLPTGTMRPAGYLVREPAVRFDRPVQPYATWRDRLPTLYAEAMGMALEPSYGADSHREISRVPDYAALMPMAADAHKVIFDLKPADGAMGSMMLYVSQCHREFEGIARDVLAGVDGRRSGFPLTIGRTA